MARGQLVGQRAAPPSVLEKMVLAQKTPVTLGSVAVGETIVLKVDGAPREWIVVNHGTPSGIYSSTFTGGNFWLMKDIYEKRQWHSADVNDYANSTIHTYLNNTFIAKLDADVQAAIKQVKIPYRAGSGNGTAVTSGESGLAAKVWLPSGYELGLTKSASDGATFPAEGAKFAYFLSGETTEANKKRIGLMSGTAQNWETRSPYCHSSTGATSILLVGTTGEARRGTGSGAYTIRPCIVLPDTFTASVPTFITDAHGTPLYIPEEQVIGGVKTAAGSYTGTGKYGASNPNALTLGFAPKLVIITCRAEESYGGFGWVSGTPKGKTAVIGNTLYKANITWRSDGLSWYADGDSQQLNQSDLVYDYIAIG